MVTKNTGQRETAPAHFMYANSVGEVFCQPCSCFLDSDLTELEAPEDYFCENCHPPTTPKIADVEAFNLAQRHKKGKKQND